MTGVGWGYSEPVGWGTACFICIPIIDPKRASFDPNFNRGLPWLTALSTLLAILSRYTLDPFRLFGGLSGTFSTAFLRGAWRHNRAKTDPLQNALFFFCIVNNNHGATRYRF